MLNDLVTFGIAVFRNVMFWLGLVTFALRYRAEHTNEPSRTFLGRPRLWGVLSKVSLAIACFHAWQTEHHATDYEVQLAAGAPTEIVDGQVAIPLRNYGRRPSTSTWITVHVFR